MTDEEFYKIALLEAIQLIYKYIPHLQDKNKLEKIFSISLEDVHTNLGGYHILNIQRKLILTEKTWYKRRDGALVYCIGKIRTTDCRSDKMVMYFLESGNILHYELSGSSFAYTNDTADIIRECTPEEIKEIEEKFR